MAEYMNVGKVSDFPDGAIKPFTLDGEDIAIVNSEGRFYAFSNECTHVGASLAEGYVAGAQVVCGRHGSVFDMITGNRVEGPADDALSVYDVKVEGDDVLVGKQ